MTAGRAHRGGILAGCNLTAEGDALLASIDPDEPDYRGRQCPHRVKNRHRRMSA